MLSIQNRLTKEKDFKLVFKNGKTVKNSFLVLKFFKNNLKESRFGFIISKKISNKATVRNKIKRRLRDIIFKELNKFKRGYDIIIIILPQITKEKFPQIKKAMSDIFKEAGLMVFCL